MIRETVHALLACVVSFAICAVAYPVAVYGLGHTLFPGQASGSLVERDGKVIGSRLIAQPFASEKYFSPRPSAAGASGYSADAASGSNLATTNPALHDRIALDAARLVATHSGDADLKGKLERLDSLQADLKAKKEIKEPSPADTEAIAKLESEASSAQGQALERSNTVGQTETNRVPVDLVTTSGAGLDPDISLEAARYQAPRVASARKMPVDQVLKLIDDHADRSGVIIGAPPRINVLLLNLELDKTTPAPAVPAAAPSASLPAEAPATTPPGESPSSADVVTKAEAPSPAAETTTAAATTTAVEALAGRVDRLQEKLDAAAAENLADDVKSIKAQVATLVAASTPIAGHLAGLDAKVGGFERDIRSLQNERSESQKPAPEEIATLGKQVQALGSQLETLRESVKKRPVIERATPVPAPTTGLDLAPAVALFRQQRYTEAAQSFRALAESRPDDARPWYFAALANGLASGRWTGETEDFLKKGMERERAGSPETSEIDTAFASLTRETGKDWLGFYRRQAAR